MSDDISFQTWICPKCYDDHRRDGPCSPMGVDKFSPAKDDHSYIAEEFRKLEARCAWQAEMLERARIFAEQYGTLDGTAETEWLVDLEKGNK